MMENNVLDAVINQKHIVSHDTIKVHVKTKTKLGNMKVSCFVFMYGNDNKKPYTPVAWSEDELIFIVKVYGNCGVSHHIHTLNVGDVLRLSYPIQKLTYNPEHNNVLMICGGTGVTPMLQILSAERCKSKFTVLCSNKSFSDILLNRNICDGDLDVYHVITNTQHIDINKRLYYVNPDYSNVFSGRITRAVVDDIHTRKNIAKFDFVYVCGDKTENKEQGTLCGILKELAYDSTIVYKF